MNRFFLIISLVCAIFLSGADAAWWNKKPAEPAKQEYVTSVKKVSPPSGRKPVVVLPSKFAQREVIVEDTPEYQSLVSANEELQNQLATEQQNYDSYRTNVDQAIQAQIAENKRIADELIKAKTEAGKKSWFAKLFGWLAIGMIPLLGIGLIVLCAMNPVIALSAFKIIFNIGRLIAGFFGRIFSGIATLFSKKA